MREQLDVRVLSAQDPVTTTAGDEDRRKPEPIPAAAFAAAEIYEECE